MNSIVCNSGIAQFDGICFPACLLEIDLECGIGLPGSLWIHKSPRPVSASSTHCLNLRAAFGPYAHAFTDA